MTLADAQKAKLDLICRKLQLKPGEKFLDIGCGWGALIHWAVTHYGVSAHGITLSKEQLAHNLKWIEDEGLQDKVTAELLDYRDLPKEPTFDKISSIGMIEHVGIANYQLYYRSVMATLKPGGLFLNHGITLNRIWQPEIAFILRYIFPDAQCPPVNTYLQFAANEGWEIVDLDCWRPHYAKTLRAWASNLEAKLDQAIPIVGSRIKIWQLYLIMCAQGFENGANSIYQMLLRRAVDSEWNLPMTRDDWLC
jgi:cyclopropane-fatty-acyl-phospholipid synthase